MKDRKQKQKVTKDGGGIKETRKEAREMKRAEEGKKGGESRKKEEWKGGKEWRKKRE